MTTPDDFQLSVRLERARSDKEYLDRKAIDAETTAARLRKQAQAAQHHYDNLLLELQGQLTIDEVES